jgi:prepilin-type N-terminal cleavage/methylation domain-containing protein
MSIRLFTGHRPARHRDKRRVIKASNGGFSLLELSIVLVIIALVTGMAISSGISVVATARQAATTQKMKAIDQALMAFRIANNRLPCPGDLTIAPGGANFGVEAGGSLACTTGTGVCTNALNVNSNTGNPNNTGTTMAGTCIGTALSPAANFSALGATLAAGPTSSNRVGAEGALPVATLGLPSDYMVDGWGNRFRYAVDSNMTMIGAFHDSPVNNTCGAITVNDVNGNARATDAIYALVSHGPNGHGAYTSSGAVENAGSVNANELINCHCSSTTGADNGTYAATYVQEQSPTLDPSNSLDTYDDLVTYKERWQMQAAWDPVATYYFAQTTGDIISKVQGCTITTVAGTGTMGYSGDGGAATGAELKYPIGVAVDNSGNLYIGDEENYRVRKVTVATGIITTVAGTGTYGYSGDGGAATSAKVTWPNSLAVDSFGNLYIADICNNRIREVTAATGIITTVAGNGTSGYTGDGGQATSAELHLTQGAYCYGSVAVDRSGNLYIADAFNNRIRKVTAATGIITTVAGNGTAGYTGDAGAAISAELNQPLGTAVDSSGNIYIDDTLNYRVRKVTVATGIITTIAGNGTSSSYSYNGDGIPATSVSINPGPLAIDMAGNVYIADGGNVAIRMVAASTGIITTVAGNIGWWGGSNGVPAAGASLSNPSGIAIVPSGAPVLNR